MMSVAVMKYSREEAVDYLARAISRFARREYIMFTHNPGNHCIPPVNQVSLRYAILAQLHISRLAKLSLDTAPPPSRSTQNGKKNVIPGFSQDRAAQL